MARTGPSPVLLTSDHAPGALARPSHAARSTTGKAPVRTLVDIFSSSVALWPDRVALDEGSRCLTYRQLAEEAQRVADRLGATGAGRGDRVGIRVPSGTADLYVAVLGVLFAGAAYVPVDFADPAQRAEQTWCAADACAVVGTGLTIEARHRGRAQTRGPVGPADDCWVIFTSGSTGTPKGVVVSHRAAAAFVDAEAGLWEVGQDDRVLAGLSVGFDASCEEMWLAWRNGAALVPCPRSVVQAGADLGPWLLKRGISVVSTVPTLASMWEDDVLANVRLLILGGEACPSELGWRLATGREVWNTYGPTEATVVSTAARIRPGRPVTIGWPLPGWDVAVVDRSSQPVAPGEAGELVIGGVGLGRYLDPVLDARAYASLTSLGWARAYRTGDTVRWGEDGLEFIGRRDDQVKLGGRRIELGEVDANLCAAPGVRAAAAAVRETAGGNPVLVGYVVGDVDPADVRCFLAKRLPAGIVPLVVPLGSLPLRASGKVDRRALPWPPPPLVGSSHLGDSEPGAARRAELAGTMAWLADRWADQLGPLPMTAESDFFELGGTSLAVARLVSVLRNRYPAMAVADVYNHRRLGQLAERLDHLGEAGQRAAPPPPGNGSWGVVQLLGVLALVALGSLQWVIGTLAYDQWDGRGLRIGWAALVVGWLLLSSAPGRAVIVMVARKALLGRLRTGRYPLHGWLSCRLWFVERLAHVFHLEALAGTPWTARYARMNGADVGKGVHLRTLPPPTALVRIGAGATLETEVDVHGWWVDGGELVVGEVRIGEGARIGARSLLMPGADVGAGAEIEPGSVVSGMVPPGERWSGSPARPEAQAGTEWPADGPGEVAPSVAYKAMYAIGLAFVSLLPLVAAAPGAVVLATLGNLATPRAALHSVLVDAPLVAAAFILTYALLTALAVRSVSWLVRPGWHPDTGPTAWALWFGETVMARAKGALFPLYMSVYTRSWLRLLGAGVGKGTEMSTFSGLNRLVRIAGTSFAADDVAFAGNRARGGWIDLRPIEVGSRTFLGNGAILRAGTRLGDDCLVGLLSSPPFSGPDGTSWFGLPALEFPRVPEPYDPTRTTTPPRRFVLARGAIELLRILFPATISVLLGALVFVALEDLGTKAGPLGLLGGAPVVVLAASLCAVVITIGTKWALMGRYKPGTHPFWSFFVWRDEVVNTCQEQLAGAWLLSAALGSPVLPAYLRAMGARVGKGVWFETLAVTEFDLVELGDRCAVNRGACIETHLFHDRLLRMGPATLGNGSTLGPHSAVLPDTVLGTGCTVGARSVVLRGEHLPAGTAWHGAPVQSR